MTAPTPSHPARLARRLGTSDAVVIGLGSMIGAGVFAAFAPAAHAAGSWLLAGLAVAAVVAYCNATSSARLAARYPSSGGTYVYGRERLGPFWGYLAGWAFVVGKTASCAAMALTFAAYAGLGRPAAVAAVVALTALNWRGVHKSAIATKIIVAIPAIRCRTGPSWRSVWWWRYWPPQWTFVARSDSPPSVCCSTTRSRTPPR